MVVKKTPKTLIGVVTIVVFIVGLYLGISLTTSLGTLELQIINMGIALASIILLLIIGGLLLEIREVIETAKVNK